jgi:integrase
LVPLCRQAIALLEELHSLTAAYPLLFPGRSDRTKPRSDTVLLMVLRRLGYRGRQTGQDFRHIASTILNEQGFSADHSDAQLSHKAPGVRGICNKAQYLEQRTTMLQWYADHLDKLAAGNVGAIYRQVIAKPCASLWCVCRYRLNPITVQIPSN